MGSKQLRVLQVITNLGTGGAEKLLVDSIPIYIKKGIDMDILLLNGTQYPFFDQLRSNNVKIFSLGLTSVYNPFLVFKIIPYLKKYEIIHVHLFPTLYWVALAKILSFSNVKLIFTEHSTNNRRMNSFWGTLLDRCIYRMYDRIISITEGMDDIMKRHLKIKDKQCFRVISNGVDLSRFFMKPSFSPLKPSFRLIQISSFNKAKDQSTLIKSLPLLPHNVEIVLVGDGENRAYCEQLVKEINVVDRVHFLGIRTDIPELLHSADIVILSSHYEGLSLSSIEGMISGRPFIASDVPGLSDIVRGAGVLFPVGDEKALASIIRSLLVDEKLYMQIVDACQERAKKYDINIMVDSYIDLYKTLINN